MKRRLPLLAAALAILLALPAGVIYPPPVVSQVIPAGSCDGVSDRSSAINAAIALAVTIGNNAVYIPAGTGACIIDASLSVPSNVTLKGDGRGVTVLKLKTNANTTVIVNSDQVAGNTGLTLRDFTIDGNKANQSATVNAGLTTLAGINFFAAQNVYIHGVEVHDAKGTGIITNGGGLFIGPMQISDIYVHDNGARGYQLSNTLRRSTITGVIAEGNGGEGVLFDASQVTASAIYARQNGGGAGLTATGGIYMRNITAGTFVGLAAEANQWNGIELDGCAYCVGAGWRAQQNGQKTANTYDDISFNANPFGGGASHGETQRVSVAGIVVGMNEQIQEGVAATERYGIYVSDTDNDNISLTGIQYSSSFGTGPIRMPASPGMNFTIQVKASAISSSSAPTTGDDITTGVSIGSVWTQTTTGDVWVNRSNAAGAAVWTRIEPSDHPGYVAGRYYAAFGQIASTGSAPGSAALFLTPIYVKQRITISEIGTRISTLSGGGNIQMALYKRISNANPLPGLLIDKTASMTTGSAAVVTAAMGGNQQVEPGLYWIAIQHDNGTSITNNAGPGTATAADKIGDTTAANIVTGATSALGGYSVTNTFGSWPSDLTSASLTARGSALTVFTIFKVASVPRRRPAGGGHRPPARRGRNVASSRRAPALARAAA